MPGSSGKKGSFTWQEVAKHNTAESSWVIVDGRVYDVTPFLDSHPGGKEMLLLAAGRECTDLFRSYHWINQEKPRKYMASYEIGLLSGPTELPTYAPDTVGFYATLSSRIKAHFEKTKLDPKSPWAGVWRIILILAVALTAYALSCLDTLPTALPAPLGGAAVPWSARVVAALVFGVFQAMPLLHAMHDASHAAIGHSEVWWKGMGRLCLDWFAGGMMISWHHQHIVGHHVYTNVMMADPDLPYVVSGDVRFLDKGQAWTGAYKYQWLYLPVLYGVLGFRTRVQDVFSTWLANDCGPVRVNFYGNPWIRVVFTKLVWASWRLYLPLAVLRIPQAHFWTLFWVSEIMTGFWLAWNFEVSHVTDTVLWPVEEAVGSKPKDVKAVGKREAEAPIMLSREETQKAGVQMVLPQSWAESQVRTGVDYGHNSWATAFWTGALNYQIEHHLFPGISQYHYPALAPIVMQACKCVTHHHHLRTRVVAHPLPRPPPTQPAGSSTSRTAGSPTSGRRGRRTCGCCTRWGRRARRTSGTEVEA
jgi:fatty acid desaturase